MADEYRLKARVGNHTTYGPPIRSGELANRLLRLMRDRREVKEAWLEQRTVTPWVRMHH